MSTDEPDVVSSTGLAIERTFLAEERTVAIAVTLLGVLIFASLLANH